MKKRIFIFITIFVVMFFVLCFFFIQIKNSTESCKVLVIKKTYNYVDTYDEIGQIDIDLYVSNKNSFITEKKSVGNCYIKSNQEKLEVKLLDIIDRKESVKINNELYYLYKFSFSIAFQTEADIEFSFIDAFLEMSYPDEEIEINIGSFYYLKVGTLGDDQNKLLLPKIRPIVNNINNNKTLVGINIGFENLKKDEILVTNVRLLSANAVFSGNEFKTLESEYSSSDNIDTILGYNYDYNYSEENDISFKISNSIDCIFPVKYKNDYVVDKAGLLIEYKVNGNIYYYYINEFLFFSSMNYNLNESNFEVYSYGNR